MGELTPLARELSARNHETTLCVRELHGINTGEIQPCNILQSPVMLANIGGLPEPPLNYAEMMLRFGYHSFETLHNLVCAWHSTFNLLRADILVASHSPTAMLAARTLDLPTVTVGSGFCVPPRVNPTPNMRPWMQAPMPRMIEADKLATDSINKVLERYGRPPIGSLAELFDVRANLLCTFPEFDHYQPRIPELQNGLYCGPIIETSRGDPITWPDTPGKKVLVYLRPETRDMEAILQSLVATGCTILAAIPGISEPFRKQLESAQCRIFDHGIHLASILPECDLAINYAGHGYVAAVLAAGVPMLLVPMHLEQFLLAQRVSNIGAGVTVNPDSPPPDYHQLIPAILANINLKQAARKFSEKYQQFDQASQLASIIQLIESAAKPD